MPHSDLMSLPPGRGATKQAPQPTPEEDEEEVEPSWELPEDMREWTGDATDRKGMLLFRQAQQTARQVPTLSLILLRPSEPRQTAGVLSHLQAVRCRC